MSHVTHLVICLLALVALTRGFLQSSKMYTKLNGLSASRLLSQLEETSEDALEAPITPSPSPFAQSKRCMNAAMLGLALFSSAPLPMNTVQPVHAAATSATGLESSIAALENANGKAEIIQSLADVFEAAESKTLLVRTKYKTRIINAVNTKRATLSNEWDNVLGYESGELKRRVDPFRTVDLKPYLDVAPFVGGALYLAALFVQVTLPELFVFAYPAAAAAFFAPALAIIIFN